MVSRGVVSPWLRDSRGRFISIKHGVSRARNFVKWARYARNFGTAASRAAGVYGLAATGIYYGAKYLYKRFTGGKRSRGRSRSRSTGAGRSRSSARYRTPATRARPAKRLSYGTRMSSRSRSASRSRGSIMGVGSAPRQLGEYLGGVKHTMWLSRAKRIPRKDLKLGYQKVVRRWQRVNVSSSAGTFPGGLPVSHKTSTSGTGTVVPMYFVNLNQIQNGTTAYTNGPVYDVSFSDVGAVVFNSVFSQTNSGALAADGNWQIESYDPELSGEPQRHVMCAWYDVRLNLYGCTAQPTVFDIMVVSFPSGYLDPLEIPSNAQELNDRHALYQGLVQKYMSNPIMPTMQAKPQYVVHKRMRYTFQPTLSVENDSDPANKVVKLFINDKNVYDYRYHGDGFIGAGADDKLSTTQWNVQGAVSTDYSNRPAAKARKWLVIRALNPNRDADETAANTPSFDVCIRQCTYQQTGN